MVRTFLEGNLNLKFHAHVGEEDLLKFSHDSIQVSQNVMAPPTRRDLETFPLRTVDGMILVDWGEKPQTEHDTDLTH